MSRDERNAAPKSQTATPGTTTRPQGPDLRVSDGAGAPVAAPRHAVPAPQDGRAVAPPADTRTGANEGGAGITPVRGRGDTLSVGVLVDLEWGPAAGGHVKCWERFAEAAALLPTELDLTVYFLGDKEGRVELADNARFHVLPPAFGTNRFKFLQNGGGHTDLARHHGRLADLLPQHQLLHATDTFTFAQTAKAVSRKRGIPLVSSIHTDLPTFTRIYTREIVERQLGSGMLSSLVLDTFGAADIAARNMRSKLRALAKASRHVLISKPQDARWLIPLVGEERISRLRRGIDKALFNPKNRDRTRLDQEFGIPEERCVLLFAGRLDDSKRVMTLARAARTLLDEGHKLHVILCGRGAAEDEIRRLLGPNASLPGNVPQGTLAWLYASSDLFVFPSESEVSPNVVIEAKASGLPVVISARDGGAQFVDRPGYDGILVQDRSDDAWISILRPLVDNTVTRASIAYNARKSVENDAPSWEDVLAQDLVPVWRRVANAARRRRRA